MVAYVVQSAQNVGTFTAATGTVSAVLGPVRTGNCLVVVAADASNGSSNGSVSAVRFQGLQDNFAQLATSGGTATPGLVAWWADPLCAGSTTAGTVSVVYGGISGTASSGITVMEVGGLLPSGGYLLDVAVQGTSSSAVGTWNSGTAITSATPEMWVGAVIGGSVPTGPGYPWVNFAVQQTSVKSLVGYQLTQAQGSATFFGTFAGTATYNAGAVTLRGLPAVAPSLPAYIAGFGPDQGDMNTVFTSPLAFWQQRTVFRAAQLTTTTGLAPSGSITTIGYDTILEDPYQGWSTLTQSWTAPYTGWYHVTASVSTGAASADTLLTLEIDPPAQNAGAQGCLVLPTTGGIIQGELYCLLVGGQDTVNVQAFVTNAGGTVSTTNSPGSTVEIMWVASAV